MEKIKVVEVSRLRDGGTVIYRDELNRRYYQWLPTGKVYNRKGRVEEVTVELEVINEF